VGRGGVPVGASAWRMEKEGENGGPTRGRQLDHAVGMAPGGAIGGGSPRSRRGQASEQGRAAW
jgi:hypothetical protein